MATPDRIDSAHFEAVLHQSAGVYDRDQRQRCVLCGGILLDHRSAAITNADGWPVIGGQARPPFPNGPVTVLIPLDQITMRPVAEPIAVASAVPGARPCLEL